MKDIKYLINALDTKKRYATLCVLVMLMSTAAECFSISLIFPVMQAIVYGEPQGKFADILEWGQSVVGIKLFLPFICILLLAAVLIKTAISLLNLYMSKKLALEMHYIWISSIFKKYMNSHISTVLLHKQGELLHNLINETRRASVCIMQMAQYIAGVLLALTLLVMMFMLAPGITFSILITGLVAMLIMSFMKNYSKKVGRERQKLLKEITESATEGIGGIRQIKTLNLESWINRYFSSKTRQLFEIELNFEFLRVLPAKLTEVIVATIMFLIILYIFFGTDMELKNILPTLALTGVIGMKILKNIARISSLHWQVVALLPAVRKIEEELNTKVVQDPLPGGKHIEQILDDLIIKNVCFTYKETVPPVLKNLNLRFQKNSITAITGPSGSGKSTMADLIMGFYSPSSGEILVNAQPLTHWNIESWRSKIGYVSQDIHLFHSSIKDNITVGMTNYDKAKVIHVAKNAHAHKFITSLPEGYDTIVGDRGTNLSGGERQRIAIARALIRNPEIVIFDEVTSALDPKSEKYIIEIIKELSKEKIVIVISHRPNILKKADTVYNLGKISDAIPKKH